MTVLIEALFAETLLFEDSRRCFSCGVQEVKDRNGFYFCDTIRG